MLAQDILEPVGQPGVVLQPGDEAIFDGALLVRRVLLPDGRRVGATRGAYGVVEIRIVVVGPVPLGEGRVDLQNAVGDGLQRELDLESHIDIDAVAC